MLSFFLSFFLNGMDGWPRDRDRDWHGIGITRTLYFTNDTYPSVRSCDCDCVDFTSIS